MEISRLATLARFNEAIVLDEASACIIKGMADKLRRYESRDSIDNVKTVSLCINETVSSEGYYDDYDEWHEYEEPIEKDITVPLDVCIGEVTGRNNKLEPLYYVAISTSTGFYNENLYIRRPAVMASRNSLYEPDPREETKADASQLLAKIEKALDAQVLADVCAYNKRVRDGVSIYTSDFFIKRKLLYAENDAFMDKWVGDLLDRISSLCCIADTFPKEAWQACSKEDYKSMWALLSGHDFSHNSKAGALDEYSTLKEWHDANSSFHCADVIYARTHLTPVVNPDDERDTLFYYSCGTWVHLLDWLESLKELSDERLASIAVGHDLYCMLRVMHSGEDWIRVSHSMPDKYIREYSVPGKPQDKSYCEVWFDLHAMEQHWDGALFPEPGALLNIKFK